MLILRALIHQPRHGLGIADRIQPIWREVLRVAQGSLYPALYRLEAEGLIAAEWGVSDKNRRVRLYALTAGGRATDGRRGALGSYYRRSEHRAHESLTESPGSHEPL